MLLRWTDNPIYQAETRHLRRPGHPVKWGYVVGRVLLFIPVALIACIPSVIYIDGFQDNWLNLMLLTAILVQVALTVRAAAVTSHLIQHDYTSGNWDLLRLTNISAQQFVIGKWQVAFRLVWFDFALFSIIKLGLAVALVHYLHLSWWHNLPAIMGTCPQDWPSTLSKGFCYHGNVIYQRLPGYEAYQFQPSLNTMLIAGSFTFGFALLESGYFTAMSLWLQVRFKRWGTVLHAGAVCIMRVGMIATAYLSLFIITENRGGRNYDIHVPPYAIRWDAITRYRAVETFEVAITPLLDNGVLLNANIMRPEAAFRDVAYAVEYLPGGGYDAQMGAADTCPFVFRNIVAALLGMGLYALLIRYFLHQAQIVAIRQHGLRGVVEV